MSNGVGGRYVVTAVNIFRKAVTVKTVVEDSKRNIITAACETLKTCKGGKLTRRITFDLACLKVLCRWNLPAHNKHTPNRSERGLRMEPALTLTARECAMQRKKLLKKKEWKVMSSFLVTKDHQDLGFIQK